MAKKPSQIFVCQNCSYQSPKWLGKCPDCQEWNSMVEDISYSSSLNKTKATVLGGGVGMGGGGAGLGGKKDSFPKTIDQIQADHHIRYQTGIGEFDRVVGSGLVRGSVTLIGGEPGIGKSTLLMEVAGRLAQLLGDGPVLYVSGEESEAQVAARSKRLGIKVDNFLIYHESIWQHIHDQLQKLKPQFIVIDSIQTTYSLEILSAPGTISQIREITYELVNYAKANNVTCFIIGHVTKEGSIAGPKILEHMVDTVIYFEGDQHNYYRLLRVIKNRFGNANEVGIFEMGERGLVEVGNPSQYFLDQPLGESFGRCVTSIVEGSRNLFVEVQALVVDNKYGNGRRTTQGIDLNRLSMIIAVIEKYFGIYLSLNDIYVNVVGGMKLVARDSDLCIMAAILSSLRSKPIDQSYILLGEVGLTGEVRSVPMMEMRLKEMNQLNYKKVITSARSAKDYQGKFDLEIIGITKASELEGLLF